MENPLIMTKISVQALIPRNSEEQPGPFLFLHDREFARFLRDCVAELMDKGKKSSVYVLDLDGVVWTPSAMLEFILPLALRARGGEYGDTHLVIASSDKGLRDSVVYMARAHQLPLYVTEPMNYFQSITQAGSISQMGMETLGTIGRLGGRVTAAAFAEQEGIKASAAQNRLSNLEKEGYLVRQPRSRREGDVYLEPGKILQLYANSLTEPRAIDVCACSTTM